jgi:hypothetical protein
VIARDFDFVGIVLLPTETDPVLLVDPDAVLSLPVPPQLLQSIPGWNAQFLEILHPVQLIQLAANNGPKSLWTRAPRLAAIHTEKQVLRGPLGK